MVSSGVDPESVVPSSVVDPASVVPSSVVDPGSVESSSVVDGEGPPTEVDACHARVVEACQAGVVVFSQAWVDPLVVVEACHCRVVDACQKGVVGTVDGGIGVVPSSPGTQVSASMHCPTLDPWVFLYTKPSEQHRSLAAESPGWQ